MNDDQIRQEAERRFRVRKSSLRVDTPAARGLDTEELLRELHIHQLELEIQNEELRRTQRQLEKSRRRHYRLYEFAPVGYLTVRPDGRILSTNRCVCDMAGTDRRTFTRAGLFSIIDNADHGAVVDLLRRVLEMPGRRMALDVRLFAAHERYAHMEAVCAEKNLSESDPEVHVCLTDVTAEKHAEERARSTAEQSRLLLRELNHRIKNNLQLLLSLVMLQRNRTEDPAAQAALAAVEERVRTVTFSHQSLDSSSATPRAELIGLLDPLVRQFAEQQRIRIDFISSVEELLVDGNAALSLALAVNELVSNAVKHSRGGADQAIAVMLDVEEATPTGGRLVRVSVTDSGPGLPPELLSEHPSGGRAAAGAREGLGFTLVGQLVEQQLGGCWKRRNRPAGGAEHRIEVKL